MINEVGKRKVALAFMWGVIITLYVFLCVGIFKIS